jgi:hypothetical protein
MARKPSSATLPLPLLGPGAAVAAGPQRQSTRMSSGRRRGELKGGAVQQGIRPSIALGAVWGGGRCLKQALRPPSAITLGERGVAPPSPPDEGSLEGGLERQ